MGKTRGSTKDRETRDAEAAERLAKAHEELTAAIEALASGDDWETWLKVASRFRHYSANNVFLITVQCPEASRVTGYRTWQSLGRNVIKGEKAIHILGPVFVVDKERTEAVRKNDPSAKSILKLVGFKTLPVFDISQTEGDPLPDVTTPKLLEGVGPAGLWAAVQEQIEAEGYTVERGDCGRANGLTDPFAKKVIVRPDVDEAQACKTLIHELAHVLLHCEGENVTSFSCRSVKEVEAESVAYLVADQVGLDSGAYTFPYVASWAGGDVQVVKDTATRVVRAAQGIVGKLEAGKVEGAENAEDKVLEGAAA